MVRKTSIDTYHKIKENGLLGRRQWQVYEILFKHGPITGSEVAIIFKKYNSLAPNAGNMVTRLGELRDKGVVAENGTTICPITSQRVTLWDVTDKLPKKINQSKLATLLQKQRRLEKKLAQIKKQIASSIYKQSPTQMSLIP